MFDAPVNQDFKDYFVRDFPYGGTLDEVTDADIDRALAEAGININQNLFSDQASFTTAFLYLAAHNMVTNIQTSSQGIAANASWLVASKSVASVSESFTIPERIQKNPQLAMLSKTRYGMKYLEIVIPRLLGQVFVVCGGTTP